nr:MAG TPA: hypothetical protein [Caudoviricetes sp.]
MPALLTPIRRTGVPSPLTPIPAQFSLEYL